MHLLLAQWSHGCCSYRVMVAQAGPTSVGPVSVRAGISTPSGLPPVSVETPVVA
ncbi:hypothetical protein IUJ34_09700 [Klebsiella pneumoniae subsp. pneumoniae]|uniref:Uncharacterized protein n=1 Tax=Klebsiella pneumoniae subsp. pneumoniae TaxID=72407 RepID=A0A7S9E1H6_KLEPN|nr:hypothetical protein IUJ34_09700 [Klebsiella pneumoniae subsp. pneumoniae]